MNARTVGVVLVVVGLGAGAFAWRGCAARPPGGTDHLVIDRVHDFMARLEQAEFSDRSAHQAVARGMVDGRDPRDRLAYIRNLTGTSVTFTGLHTGGPAHLEFGVGVGWRNDGVADVPVRFLVEARDELRAESEWTRVFATVVRPAELPPDTLVRAHRATLPVRDAARWTLRFTTERVDSSEAADDAPLTWPAWHAPRLVSDGRRVPWDEHPVRLREVVFSSVRSFDRATVLRERKDAPVEVMPLDAARDYAESGGEKTTLRMKAPARVRQRITIPSDTQLELGYGVDTATGWTRQGDGMTFAVEIDGERVWSEHLDAHRLQRDRGWKSHVLDLAEFAGRTVDFDLVTETGADTRNDVGGFHAARLVRYRAVRRRPASEAPTVIVVLVDTLRADRLGAYGHTGGLTPVLDAFARDGIVFRGARSASSWTWPATASILTGLTPADHGVLDARRSHLSGDFETLAERFQAHGYTTGAFVANPLIGPVSNLTQGFETFVLAPLGRGRALHDRVLAWMDTMPDVARLVYIHAFDTHAPYSPGPEYSNEPASDGSDPAVLWAEMLGAGPFDDAAEAGWRELVEPRYDAEVRRYDAAFGELLAGLEERGVLDDAVIVFVSDHGEEFFEHGQFSHGGHLYDETLAVPLIVTGFGRSRLQPAVVHAPVETRNLLPTLCALAGVTAPAHPGLADTLLDVGRPGSAPLFGVTTHGYEPGIEGWTDKRSVIVDRFKLIHTPASGRVELYDLNDDPREERDLSAQHPELTNTLLGRLDAWWAAGGARGAAAGPARDDVQRTLEALGYVERR